MDERLLQQLKFLDKYISALQELAVVPEDKYMNDMVLQGAAERYLQLAIETCLNIGNRILALEQRRQNITAPETYAEIFEKLAQIGVIPAAFSAGLVNMARFRNLLVHMYWEIDPGKVYEILSTGLNDLRTFRKYAAGYIKSCDTETI